MPFATPIEFHLLPASARFALEATARASLVDLWLSIANSREGADGNALAQVATLERLIQEIDVASLPQELHNIFGKKPELLEQEYRIRDYAHSRLPGVTVRIGLECRSKPKANGIRRPPDVDDESWEKLQPVCQHLLFVLWDGGKRKGGIRVSDIIIRMGWESSTNPRGLYDKTCSAIRKTLGVSKPTAPWEILDSVVYWRGKQK